MRLAMIGIIFSPVSLPGAPRHVKGVEKIRGRNNKGGKSLFTVKLRRLLCVTLRPNTSACLGVSPSRSAPWASSSIDAGFIESEIRSLSVDVVILFLLAKPQTSHYLVVSLNICALQIIQQTSALRDHLEQAPPGVVIFLVDFKVLGKLVDPLAE